MFKKIAMTTLLGTSVLFAESGVGINVNETDFEVEGVLDSRNLAAMQTSSTVFQLDANFINNSKNNNDNNLLGVGIGATNALEGVEGVELTFGAKFIWSTVDYKGEEEHFNALPLLAKVRYTFPPLMFNIPPIALEGKVMYAPGALSFGDSQNYSEFRASADMEVIESVRIYAGYRNIVTGYKNDKNYVFNNGFYGGLKFVY
ncbi:MAG TPA: hypothetical protein ENK86_02430 [Campylobacterales bacterium]|nr:hypothetical protein [Campylobacterales bacterium]